MTETRNTAGNTGLAKVAVLCSADTFVVKIATFAKPENVVCNLPVTLSVNGLLTIIRIWNKYG
jgi:hypothetical protein